MKVTGIITEFNPFHKGHKYLLDNVRAGLNPDAIVCVMSGDFMQRGYPSMWDKYTRAKMAIKQGVDLVVELPTCYAVNSAKEFARGGVFVLKNLGCIDSIAFGSECGDLDALNALVDIDDNPVFSEKLKGYLDKGYSYPLAYSKASGSKLFDEPNNTLAVEYLREIKKQHAKFDAFTVKRFYGISASNLREDIKKGRAASSTYPRPSWDYSADERLFAALRCKILEASEQDLANVLEVCEGLENRIKDAALEAKSFDDLVQRIKSKRYTYAKVSRILMQFMLGMKKDTFKKDQKTVKILAFNDKGKKVLKLAKEKGKLSFGASEFDTKANDLYSILCGKDIYSNSDLVINAKPFEK